MPAAVKEKKNQESKPAETLHQVIWAARSFCKCGAKLCSKNTLEEYEAGTALWHCRRIVMGDNPHKLCQKNIKKLVLREGDPRLIKHRDEDDEEEDD